MRERVVSCQPIHGKEAFLTFSRTVSKKGGHKGDILCKATGESLFFGNGSTSVV